jgi:hypothetical protein
VRGLPCGCTAFLLRATLFSGFLGPVFLHLFHVFAFHGYRMPQLGMKGENCCFAAITVVMQLLSAAT